MWHSISFTLTLNNPTWICHINFEHKRTKLHSSNARERKAAQKTLKHLQVHVSTARERKATQKNIVILAHVLSAIPLLVGNL